MEYINAYIRFVKQFIMRVYQQTLLLSPINKLKIEKFQKMKPLKLNVGCGKVKVPGWINIDIQPYADLIIDLRKGLPFDNESVDYIYSEHVLEHFTHEEGTKLLTDFHRCLVNGGRVRIAMPDLDYIVGKYNADWKDQDWLSWPGHECIKTKGQMINASFRWWGHKYLYNEEDLINLLVNAGFKNEIRCEWNKSYFPEFSNLETRADSKLILEAEK